MVDTYHTITISATIIGHKIKYCTTLPMIFSHDHWFSDFTHAAHSWNNENQCQYVKIICQDDAVVEFYFNTLYSIQWVIHFGGRMVGKHTNHLATTYIECHKFKYCRNQPLIFSHGHLIFEFHSCYAIMKKRKTVTARENHLQK